MGDKKKVLIIDDDPDILILYSRALDGAGFETVTQADGAKGYATAKNLNPDLIILDVMFPNISGFQILEKIKADEKIGKTPVFLISNADEEVFLKKCLELGANECLTKIGYTAQDIVNLTLQYFRENQS